MRTFYRLFPIVAVTALALAIFAPITARVTHAQDTPLVCDSTLVTLLLVAEHNYDYLTNMSKSMETPPNIEFGEYKPLLENITAMMMSMQENMTEDEIASMESQEMMMGEMMEKSNADLIKEYLASMNMDAMGETMTTLPTGALANEDPACTSLRADVEHFLLVHTIADMTMGEAMQ